MLPLEDRTRVVGENLFGALMSLAFLGRALICLRVGSLLPISVPADWFVCVGVWHDGSGGAMRVPTVRNKGG